MTLKRNAHVDPLNIDVICIDFNKFQPVSWCNPMSKWHWYLKYPKESSDDPLTFTGKNLQWANISTNIKVSDVKMTSHTLLRRIMYVVLYYFYRTINLINRWTVRPTPIIKPKHRTTKQKSAKDNFSLASAALLVYSSTVSSLSNQQPLIFNTITLHYIYLSYLLRDFLPLKNNYQYNYSRDSNLRILVHRVQHKNNIR